MLSQTRRAYARPQALVFSDKKWTFNGYAYEPPANISYSDPDHFLVLSDHNRAAISMNKNRIETRERMIDGSMRSYWIADKMNISTSWNLLPSRALPALSSDIYSENNGEFNINFTKALTVDAGAGGNELLDWHRRHQGSFYVLVAYDRFNVSTVDIDDTSTKNDWRNVMGLADYQEQYEMFFSSFEHSIEKRNQSGVVVVDTSEGPLDLTVMYDLWNVSMALEEA